jgi:uncharacterized protein with PQ loop repeat
MTFEDVVSVVAVGGTVVFAWPQVFRVVRHGVSGVSVNAITLSVVAAAAWFGYGVARGLAPVIIANFGVMTGQLVVTFELARHRALPMRRAVVVVAVATVLVGLCQIAALSDVIVTAAGLGAIASVLTQLVEVVRESHRLEGLSAGTYAILTAISACWIVYGLLEDDIVIVGTNLALLPMAGFITRAAWQSHHERELRLSRSATDRAPLDR